MFLNNLPSDPLVLVPSLFFISGETGVPLEVLGGPLAADNLKEKVTKLLGNAKPVRDHQKVIALHCRVDQGTICSRVLHPYTGIAVLVKSKE